MKKYLFMLHERDLYARIIASAQKNDIVYLLYSKEKGQIAVSDFQMYTDAKCKIQFVETPTKVPEDIAIAYTYGKLVGSTPDIIVGSKDPLIISLSSFNTAPTKKQRKPRTSNVGMNKPIIEESVKTEDAKAEPVPKRVPAKRKVAKSADDTEFDKAYNELTGFLAGLKTKSCDPSANINGITKAVATMKAESKTFKEALSLYVSPSTAKKLLATISEKDSEKLIELATRVNELA